MCELRLKSITRRFKRMKQNISFCDFCDAFPESRDDNFSYDGKKALFNYLEEYEESCDTEIDLDIVALCCEYCEFEGIEDYLKSYDTDIDKEDYTDDGDFEEEDYNEAVLEEIEGKTTLIKIEDSDSFIIQSY